MIERDEKAMLFTGTRTSSQLKLERERERLSMGFVMFINIKSVKYSSKYKKKKTRFVKKKNDSVTHNDFLHHFSNFDYRSEYQPFRFKY